MAHSANSTAAFPLYQHKASGHWCKTIKGRRHYFGKDKAEALEKWHRQKDDLLAGRKPQTESDIVTVAFVCNYCLTHKQKLVESGDLSSRQFEDLRTMAAYVVDHFGRNRSVASLGPDDFVELRAKMVARWAPSGLVARIRNIRHIFAYAYRNDVIKDAVKMGDHFAPPSKRVQRKARNDAGEKMFEAAEIRQLLAAASPHMKAFILLGVNTGIGNADLARMEHRHVDLDASWMDYPRGKTGVKRRAKLWPETVEAIRHAIAEQPKSKKYADLVFLTRFRKPWSNPESSACSLSQSFTKLAKQVELHRRGRGFYTLRHVVETIGGECRDQVAVDHVLGHDSGHISGAYRERISDERLEAVADTIYSWLFKSGGKAR